MKDVTLQIEDNMLVLRGHKQQEHKEENAVRCSFVDSDLVSCF